MDLTEYRAGESERKRIADLMRLLPDNLDSVMDVGARDGFISKLLAGHFRETCQLPQFDVETASWERARVASPNNI